MEEEIMFRTFGTMLDCSRNAVPNMTALKKWIDITSSLGYNALMLYTEETYEVPGQPFFGYLRGRFTQEELREADRYAKDHNIELIPCIQVLAHLRQLKHWPAYQEHFDVDDILLVGDEEVYTMIDDMFASISSCFTSRTLHLGMDEAHLLGRGQYYDRHGDCDRTKLMLEHLSRVCRIGEKYGFRFLMWSDMFFRLAAGGKYYADSVVFRDEIRALVPANVDLVYWDYYSTDTAHYDRMLEAHERLHEGTWFAGGLWSWTGFTPHNGFSINATKAAFESCRQHGVKDVFLTLWGDDSAECSFFALLPALFYASELAKGNADEQGIRKRFEEQFGLPFDDFMALDLPGTLNGEENAHCNQDKYALYNDCFMGIFDRDIPEDTGSGYAACAERLTRLAGDPEWGLLFRSIAALCRVLEIKADLGNRTHAVYRSDDLEALSVLIRDYKELERRLEAFHAVFRERWFAENRPQGFDVQDIRLGGLLMRIRSCRKRLEDLLEGRISRIDELEEEQLSYGLRTDKTPAPTFNHWRRTVTANSMWQ